MLMHLNSARHTNTEWHDGHFDYCHSPSEFSRPGTAHSNADGLPQQDWDDGLRAQKEEEMLGNTPQPSHYILVVTVMIMYKLGMC